MEPEAWPQAIMVISKVGALNGQQSCFSFRETDSLGGLGSIPDLDNAMPRGRKVVPGDLGA